MSFHVLGAGQYLVVGCHHCWDGFYNMYRWYIFINEPLVTAALLGICFSPSTSLCVLVKGH